MTSWEICEKDASSKKFEIFNAMLTYCMQLHLNYRHNHFYGCILMKRQYNAAHWHNEIDRDDTMCLDSLPRLCYFDSQNIHHISSQVARKYLLAFHYYSFQSHLLVIHIECHLADIYDDLN